VSSAERSHPEQCGIDTHWHLGFQSIILWLAPRIPGIRQWVSWIHSAHYRIPNWNPERSKTLPNEIWFYEAMLELQQFTGIKGLIRKI
jgi:hypothetical protein